MTTNKMVQWDFRLIDLIRDGLTGVSNVDLVCELLRPLRYRDVLRLSRLNRQVWNQFQTDSRLSRLMTGKKVDLLVKRCGEHSLWSAVKDQNISVVVELLNRGHDPSYFKNDVIRFASNYGWVTVVERLLIDPRVDPAACGNCAIGWASQQGHLEVVKRLLADCRVDPSDDNNWAIIQAAMNGHTEVVDLLLSDPRVASTYTPMTVNLGYVAKPKAG